MSQDEIEMCRIIGTGGWSEDGPSLQELCNANKNKRTHLCDV